MNYITFRNSLKDFPVFSIEDIRVAHDLFDRRRLSEWQQKGYITKIRKGHYIFSDVVVDEAMLWRVANRIYKPSYISFQTALSCYGLIPENVYSITSVSTRRTSSFETPLAHFTYRSVKTSLFFGYTLLPGGVKIASLEKAILDTFYINPSIKTEADFSSLRLHTDELKRNLVLDRLDAYLNRFRHKRLSKTTERFLRWIEHA